MSPRCDAVRKETLLPASIGRVDHALEALVVRCHRVVEVFTILRLSGAMQVGSRVWEMGCLLARSCHPAVREEGGQV